MLRFHISLIKPDVKGALRGALPAMAYPQRASHVASHLPSKNIDGCDDEHSDGHDW
jgi:hypothetical protein